MNDPLLEFQRERYIDGCARLGVEKELGKIDSVQYQNELRNLGKNCRRVLFNDASKVSQMGIAIKTRKGRLLDEMRCFK